MKLKEFRPELFDLYLDQPLVLDALVSSAIMLNERELFYPVMTDLADHNTFNKVDDGVERYAFWFGTGGHVQGMLPDLPIALDRKANPIAQLNPETVSDILRYIEGSAVKMGNDTSALRVATTRFFKLFGGAGLQ